MREIKFRMWIDYDKKMISWNELCQLNLQNVFRLPSNRKYLMQYTGLKDKNGVEIYEGDIVNIVLEENINIVEKAVIEYHGAGFYGVTNSDMWELDGYQYIEILGNIYDNPELLEE